MSYRSRFHGPPRHARFVGAQHGVDRSVQLLGRRFLLASLVVVILLGAASCSEDRPDAAMMEQTLQRLTDAVEQEDFAEFDHLTTDSFYEGNAASWLDSEEPPIGEWAPGATPGSRGEVFAAYVSARHAWVDAGADLGDGSLSDVIVGEDDIRKAAEEHLDTPEYVARFQESTEQILAIAPEGQWARAIWKIQADYGDFNRELQLTVFFLLDPDGAPYRVARITSQCALVNSC